MGPGPNIYKDPIIFLFFLLSLVSLGSADDAGKEGQLDLVGGLDEDTYTPWRGRKRSVDANANDEGGQTRLKKYLPWKGKRSDSQMTLVQPLYGISSGSKGWERAKRDTAQPSYFQNVKLPLYLNGKIKQELEEELDKLIADLLEYLRIHEDLRQLQVEKGTKNMMPKKNDQYNWDRMKKSMLWDRMRRAEKDQYNWDRMKKSQYIWDRMKRNQFIWDRMRRNPEALLDALDTAKKSQYIWDRMKKQSDDAAVDQTELSKRSGPEQFNWDRMKRTNDKDQVRGRVPDRRGQFNWDRFRRASEEHYNWDRM